MFGYIQPDMPYLYGKDATLYKAMYCGLCKSIGASCGQRARFALSFDMTFLSALLHNIMNTDVHIEKAHCVLHPIVKRPVAGDDAITRAVACLNTAFTYYKLSDDVADEHKGKIKRAFFAKGFRKSKNEHPEIARIIQRRMEELWKLEKENADSLDRAADPFGMMIADLSYYVLKEFATEYTRRLCYSIGKWVYLIDALDDYEKDIKKKNYNPFFAAFGEGSKCEMLAAHGEEVNFVFQSVFAENAECLRNIRFHFNHDLTDNIILRGIPATTKRILAGKCACKTKSELKKVRA